VVATPDVTSQLARLEDACAAEGLQLAPKVLRGVFMGRRYPWAYSAEERAILRGAMTRAREYYISRYAGWPAPSIDIFSDHDLLDGIPDFSGRSCSAGFRFVSMKPNGDVHRCGESVRELGNLLNGTFRPGNEPQPCDRRYCVYFCRKYTSDAARFAHERSARAAAVN
jgi:hypothetical protein